LTDDDDRMRRKLRAAVTDSGREILHREDKPGLANLLEIFSALVEIPVAELEKSYAGASYGTFKNDLADAAIATLAPIREKYFQLRRDEGYLLRVLEQGREVAQRRAFVTLSRVYGRVGFLESAGCVR
jgi:tryptophanyl-tRNA synthetase